MLETNFNLNDVLNEIYLVHASELGHEQCDHPKEDFLREIVGIEMELGTFIKYALIGQESNSAHEREKLCEIYPVLEWVFGA